MSEAVLISACLLGVNCTYNNSNNFVSGIDALKQKFTLIPICPEQLGGMSTPRKPCELTGSAEQVLLEKAKVINCDGNDQTQHFIKGAEESEKIAKIYNCKKAILKENSPSCGSKYIYNGQFEGKIIAGEGITTHSLRNLGMTVVSEEQLNEL